MLKTLSRKNIFAQFLIPLFLGFSSLAHATQEIFIDVRTLFDRVDTNRGVLPSVLYGTRYDRIRNAVFGEGTRFVPNPNALTFIRYLNEHVPEAHIRFYNPSGVPIKNIVKALNAVPGLAQTLDGSGRGVLPHIIDPQTMEGPVYDAEAAAREEISRGIRQIIEADLLNLATEIAGTDARPEALAEARDRARNELAQGAAGMVMYGLNGREPALPPPALALRNSFLGESYDPLVSKHPGFVISLENGFMREVPSGQNGVPELAFDYTTHLLPDGVSATQAQRQRTNATMARINRDLLRLYGPFTNFVKSDPIFFRIEVPGNDRAPLTDATIGRWLEQWPESDSKLRTFLNGFTARADSESDRQRAQGFINVFQRKRNGVIQTQSFRDVLSALRINSVGEALPLARYFNALRGAMAEEIRRPPNFRDLVYANAFEQRFSYMVGLLEAVRQNTSGTADFNRTLSALLGTKDPTDPNFRNPNAYRSTRDNSLLLQGQTKRLIEKGSAFLRLMHDDTYSPRTEFLHPSASKKINKILTKSGQIDCMTQTLEEIFDTGL